MERKLDNNTRQYLLKTLFLAEGDVLTPELAAEYSMKDDEELVYDLCEIVEYKSRSLNELIKLRQS